MRAVCQTIGVKVQAPLALAVAVAATTVPSTVKCTTAFGSPEPVNAAFDVIMSVDEMPVSLTRLSATAGTCVSTVTLRADEATPVLPATSVAVAVRLWAPLFSAAVV